MCYLLRFVCCSHYDSKFLAICNSKSANKLTVRPCRQAQGLEAKLALTLSDISPLVILVLALSGHQEKPPRSRPRRCACLGVKLRAPPCAAALGSGRCQVFAIAQEMPTPKNRGRNI